MKQEEIIKKVLSRLTREFTEDQAESSGGNGKRYSTRSWTGSSGSSPRSGRKARSFR